MDSPVTFRIYPEPNCSLFCLVNVWRDKAQMMVHIEEYRGKKYAKHHRQAGAIAQGGDWFMSSPDGRMRKSGQFCQIDCHRDQLDLEVVSHEVLHATFRWANRIRLDLSRPDSKFPNCSDEEERFCYAMGRMTKDFVGKLQRRKVWTSQFASDEDEMANKSGIHINPANKGKFTAKVGGKKKGGKLTEKQIDKGLHAKSGLERKEANFAKVERTWNHKGKKKGK